MRKRHVDPERLADVIVMTLLSDALKDCATAFARSNKTAALLTLAAIEQDLIKRIEGLSEVLAAPNVSRETAGRVAERVCATMTAIERAAEDMSLH